MSTPELIGNVSIGNSEQVNPEQMNRYVNHLERIIIQLRERLKELESQKPSSSSSAVNSSVSNHNQASSEQPAAELMSVGRIKAIKAMSGSIAHEIRTPLAAIKVAVSALAKFLPDLFAGYELAESHNLLENPLRASHKTALKELINSVIRQVDSCDSVIDVQLKNLTSDEIDASRFSTISIGTVINDALSSYPMTDDQRALVHWVPQWDFEFFGDALLAKHIIWNLLKNSLYYIKEACKGEVYIWLEDHYDYNILHFRDTAKGMPSSEANKVFEQFYTQRSNGTGLGLSFCDRVMSAFQGQIICTAESGKYAQFNLLFPKMVAKSQKVQFERFMKKFKNSVPTGA